MRTDDQTATGFNAPRNTRQSNLSMPKIGDTLGERFLLRSILGSGATGTVYAAVDATVDQKVAIKLLHPDLRDTRTRERLRREVRASRPGHPNIVSVFDLHEAGDHLFLSMELVEGRSLRDTLIRSGALPAEQVVNIGRQTASALEHLHAKGLVHRDVKPGNILLATDGVVKLCDMGLTRPLEEGVTVTETEMVVGTPDYMAPEQATGADLTGASDIYGLGLTLYQALTGEIPLKEPTAIATLSRRQHERPPSVRRQNSACPTWLDRLIRRMLEPNPLERLSATAALNAFEARRLLPRPRRRTVISAAACVVMATSGIFGVRALTHRETVQVEVGATSITGHDNNGGTTWERHFDIPVTGEVRGDLDGDGIEEICLVVADINPSVARSKTLAGPEIWVFKPEGKLLTHFIPEEKTAWDFPYDREIQATLHLLDVNHDGIDELLVVGRHLNFFPSVIFRFDNEDSVWSQILVHPGYLYDLRPTPPETVAGLRFLAVNNRMGVLGFAGEIVLDSGESNVLNVVKAVQPHGLVCPPDTSNPVPPWRLNAYVPLGLDAPAFLGAGIGLTNLTGGALKFRSHQKAPIRFDAFWNREDGPNAGRDLSDLRMEFMATIPQLTLKRQSTEYDVVQALCHQMEEQFAALLVEPAYRLIYGLMSARTLARAGALEEATQILKRTGTTIDHPEINYQFAHLEALAGHFEEAAETLTSLITDPPSDRHGTRSGFDGPHLAVRIGAEIRDPDLIEMAVARLSSRGRRTDLIRVAQALQARANLWWDDLQPEDLTVTSWGYAPAGEAIACLARWRQGKCAADEITAMEAFIDRNPDAATEGRLALAAALMGAGRPTEALDELNLLIERIRFEAGADFALHQLLDLARVMRIVALEADGQIDRARTEGAELLDTLTPGLLPAILVEELLARAL